MLPIKEGSRLGPYEILSLVGAGGMGQVWKARDTRLDRIVAIKVSEEEFSERFEREARAVAALNHPHICTLYDVGPNYLVMEYIDGKPLEGPMPLDQALKYAAQICDALDAAHKKGIVHRDLKPGNILMTKSGVKLLDFGLAQISSGLDDALTSQVTKDGLVVGTLQYMSPEQLAGKKADAHSDLYSLGLVLYEILTGNRAFPVSTLESVQPPALDRVVRTCLAKDPDARWQTAREVKLGLDWTTENRPVATSKAPTRPSWRERTAWMIVATMLLAALLVVSWRVGPLATRQAGPATDQRFRLDLDLGADASSAPSTGPNALISPDGTRLVFLSESSDRTVRLSTRRLEESNSTPLVGTQGAYAPFFSPDGQWVGFFARGKLKKTRLDGGEPIALCDAPAGRGATWSEDGSIIAALDPRAGLSRIMPDGTVTRLTVRDAGELGHRWPQALPGGKAVLFTIGSTPANYDEASIGVISLQDRRKKVVLEHAGLYPRYLPSGHLVFVTKGMMFAAPFDVDRLEVRGPATSVLEELSNDVNLGFAQVDFSRTGMILYRRGRSLALRTLEWLNSASKTEPLRSEPAFYEMQRVSPVDNRIVYVVVEGSSSDIWVYDWQRGSRNRLTSGTGVNTYPIWSPDGRYIVFQTEDGMFWTTSDGAHPAESLTKGRLQTPASFTADGKRLLFFEQNAGNGALIQTLDVKTESGRLQTAEPPRVFLETASSNPFPAFSSDGRWVAYASAETGVYEVYVRAFPDKGARWPISTSGGNFPMWSPNGRELFYRTEDQRIMVATYSVKGDSFIVDPPRLWSDKQLANLGLAANLDLAPDGKRFAVVFPMESPSLSERAGHITLGLNFFDELQRRAPLATK